MGSTAYFGIVLSGTSIPIRTDSDRHLPSIASLISSADLSIVHDTRNYELTSTEEIRSASLYLEHELKRHNRSSHLTPASFYWNFNTSMLKAVNMLIAIALEALKTYSNPPDYRIRKLMKTVKALFRNATKLVGKDFDMVLQYYKAGANTGGRARAFFTQLAARRQGLESRIAADRDIKAAAKKFMAWDNDHPEPKDKIIINHIRFTPGKREMHNNAWDRQVGRVRGFERQISVLDQCIETYQHHLNLTMEFRKQFTQLLASVSEGENRLITLKTAVQKIFLDVVYLEMYTRGPNIRFGRLDFIRCVLKLMRSEDMEVVEHWIGNGIYREKKSIITACINLLAPTDWDDVQRPYIPIDDDDLGFGYRMVGASTAGFSYVMHDSGLDANEYRPSPILALARELAAQT